MEALSLAIKFFLCKPFTTPNTTLSQRQLSLKHSNKLKDFANRYESNFFLRSVNKGKNRTNLSFYVNCTSKWNKNYSNIRPAQSIPFLNQSFYQKSAPSKICLWSSWPFRVIESDKSRAINAPVPSCQYCPVFLCQPKAALLSDHQ